MNLIEYIQQAQGEAVKQHINANSVMLNRNLMLVCESYSKIGNALYRTPPMICGLSAFLTDELPDNVAFSVLENPNPPLTREAEIKQEARQEFLDELRTMTYEDIVQLIEKGTV